MGKFFEKSYPHFLVTKIVDNVYELIIPEGATGIGYEEIFGMCVDSNLTEVLIEDPFVDAPHQVPLFSWKKILAPQFRNVLRLSRGKSTESQENRTPNQTRNELWQAVRDQV